MYRQLVEDRMMRRGADHMRGRAGRRMQVWGAGPVAGGQLCLGGLGVKYGEGVQDGLQQPPALGPTPHCGRL